MTTMELKRLPIINLWDRILVPIQGDVTDDLAEQLNTEVLRAIHESGAKGLVIDLTGVWIMDSHLCAVLSNLAAAARLMGTPTILSGLSPEIAMTLQAMGVELAAVRTALTLEQALTMLGLEVRRAEDMDRDDDAALDDGGRELPASGAHAPPSAAPGGGRSALGGYAGALPPGPPSLRTLPAAPQNPRVRGRGATPGDGRGDPPGPGGRNRGRGF